MIGGKTGTAETLPRGNDEYVVSFMGYAPVDDPQIAIYVVVDRPNIQYQDNARQATGIVRNVLTEVLPYLNIYMTEELSDKEREELEALQIQIRMADDVEDEPETDEEGNPVDPANPEGSGGDGGEGTGEDTPEEEQKVNDTWKSFPVDPESGYLKDPATGYLYDSETGTRVDGGSLLGGEEEQEEGEEGTEEGEEGGDGDDKEEGEA